MNDYTITFNKSEAYILYKKIKQEIRGNHRIEKMVVDELDINKDKYIEFLEKPLVLDKDEISNLELSYKNIPDDVIQRQIKVKATEIMQKEMRNDLMKSIFNIKKGYEDEISNVEFLDKEIDVETLIKNRKRRIRDIDIYLKSKIRDK